MKLQLLLTTVLIANYSAFAAEQVPVISSLNLKLKAFASFESGFSNQNGKKSKEKNISSNRQNLAFYNDTALFAIIYNDFEDMTYGGKIVVVPTARRKNIPIYNGSHIFMESNWGRIEAGSPIPVATNMMISSGSIPTKYINLKTEYLKQGKASAPSFLTCDQSFLGDVITAKLGSASYSNEPSRTINYYTPKFNISNFSKIRLGVSYTPDTSNTGIANPNEKSDGIDKKVVKALGVHRFEFDKGIKDVVTTGVILNQKFNENVNLDIAITAEYGKSVGRVKKYVIVKDTSPQEFKINNLRTFNIGGKLKVSNFTYSACYGSLGKSFTTPEFHKSGKNTYYYSVSMENKYNAATASVTYFASERFKNKINSIGLNVNYLLAPGFKPYVGINHFIAKGKPEFYQELSHKETKGTVLLLGAKLTL